MNKFVSPHPRASGDGYVVPGVRGGGLGKPVAYNSRLS